MLYLLLYPLHTSYSVLNVFRYITFRTLLAAIMALTVSFFPRPAADRLADRPAGRPADPA